MRISVIRSRAGRAAVFGGVQKISNFLLGAAPIPGKLHKPYCRLYKPSELLDGMTQTSDIALLRRRFGNVGSGNTVKRDHHLETEKIILCSMKCTMWSPTRV